MVVNRNKTVVLPAWLITVIVSVLTAGFVAWGAISSINVKVNRNERDLQTKIDREEFRQVYERLGKIEDAIMGLRDDRKSK